MVRGKIKCIEIPDPANMPPAITQTGKQARIKILSIAGMVGHIHKQQKHFTYPSKAISFIEGLNASDEELLEIAKSLSTPLGTGAVSQKHRDQLMSDISEFIVNSDAVVVEEEQAKGPRPFVARMAVPMPKWLERTAVQGSRFGPIPAQEVVCGICTLASFTVK